MSDIKKKDIYSEALKGLIDTYKHQLIIERMVNKDILRTQYGAVWSETIQDSIDKPWEYWHSNMCKSTE